MHELIASCCLLFAFNFAFLPAVRDPEQTRDTFLGHEQLKKRRSDAYGTEGFAHISEQMQTTWLSRISQEKGDSQTVH